MPDDRDDEDRVVSRRVDNPTTAEPGDDAAYRAANPTSDDATAAPPAASDGAPGASSTEAAAEMADENDSEPERSE